MPVKHLDLGASAMEWSTSEGQRELWTAFTRYAQTHRLVLGSIPDGAYVVLVPEFRDMFDHSSLATLLRRSPASPGTPIAYVYVSLANDDPFATASRGGESAVTDAWVEVLGRKPTWGVAELVGEN